MLQRLVRELGVLEGDHARSRARDRAAERIAYAYLPPEHVELGTAVDVEIFSSWVGGEVAKDPLFDPTGGGPGLRRLPLGETDAGIAA
jgi:hypothetical protein